MGCQIGTQFHCGRELLLQRMVQGSLVVSEAGGREGGEDKGRCDPPSATPVASLTVAASGVRGGRGRGDAAAPFPFQAKCTSLLQPPQPEATQPKVGPGRSTQPDTRTSTDPGHLFE